jgi:YVTN family beta-propeller protein
VRAGGLLLVVAGAALLAVIAVIAVKLAGSGTSSLRVAPNSVAAIDTRTNDVVASVPAGAAPAAIAFGAGSLWVANVDDQTVSRIDPSSLRALRTLSLGAPPTGLAASASAIWVTESAPTRSGVSVTSIDPQFDAVGHARRLDNVAAGGPAAVAARGETVWVAPSAGMLTRIDSATSRIVRQVDPNAGPAAVAIGADGAVWMTDTSGDNVTRVDPTGLLTPVAVGNGPSGIAVGGGGVWVADSLDDAVVRIDPTTRSVTATIPAGRSPGGMAFGAGSVWVANSGDGTVTRIDPRTNATTTIPVGGSPQAITIAGMRAWVTVDAPRSNRRTPPPAAGPCGSKRKPGGTA